MSCLAVIQCSSAGRVCRFHAGSETPDQPKTLAFRSRRKVPEVMHLKSVSRTPVPAQTDAGESLIITLFSILFQDWDNFPQVIQDLSKFFSKTP